MKAEVAYDALLTAARTLKPYTTPHTTHTAAGLLHLRSRGQTLTLTADAGAGEAAQVDLPGRHPTGTASSPRTPYCRR